MFEEVTVESTGFELETHHRQVADHRGVRRSERWQRQRNGAILNGDWLKALETTLKVSDFALEGSLVRCKTPADYLLEAANVLAGVYDGQVNVDLGDWAEWSNRTDAGSKSRGVP